MPFSVLPACWVLTSVIIIFISRHCVVLVMYSWWHMMVSFHLLGFVFPTPAACILGSTRTWLAALQRHFSPHSASLRPESKIGSIPSSKLCGPGFSYFALQGFHVYTRFSEQVSYDPCLRFVTISRSAVTSRWPWGRQRLLHSFTQNFLIPGLGGFPYFPDSLVIHLKTRF